MSECTCMLRALTFPSPALGNPSQVPVPVTTKHSKVHNKHTYKNMNKCKVYIQYTHTCSNIHTQKRLRRLMWPQNRASSCVSASYFPATTLWPGRISCLTMLKIWYHSTFGRSRIGTRSLYTPGWSSVLMMSPSTGLAMTAAA